jgi:hypothetical protein
MALHEAIPLLRSYQLGKSTGATNIQMPVIHTKLSDFIQTTKFRKYPVIHTGDNNGDISAIIRLDKAVEGTTGCAMQRYDSKIDGSAGLNVIRVHKNHLYELEDRNNFIKRNGRWGYRVGGLIGKGIVGVLDFGDVFMGDMEGAGIIGPDGDAVAVVFVDGAGEKGDLKFSFQRIVIRASNLFYGMEFDP